MADTPISESAIVGVGVGAAMAVFRPVVQLMSFDFVGVCSTSLMNRAAKLRFMSGGAVSLPMVVRTQFCAGKSSGSQHSQSLEALLAHIPGLTVVMPSTPADTTSCCGTARSSSRRWPGATGPSSSNRQGLVRSGQAKVASAKSRSSGRAA